jgi:ABC-type Fe3+ transport system permease subunit
MKKNKEKKNFKLLDERQNQIVQKAFANGYVFLVVYLIGIILYKFATDGDPIWELIGVLASALIVVVSRRLMGDIEQPVDYLNRPLPTGSSKPEKQKRFKSYLINSIMFGLGFAVMDVILLLSVGYDFLEHEVIKEILPNVNNTLTIALSAIAVFAAGFIVSFIFEYLIGECYEVKRYNKMISQLDKEENE